MPHKIKSGKRKRRSYAKISKVINLPNLIEIQRNSYNNFLQRFVPPEERENIGLQAAFSETFPITDYSDTAVIEFVSYFLDDPKYDVTECKERDMTYAMPFKIRIRLIAKEEDEDTGDLRVLDIKESDVYMGEIPLMTERGTFIINGAERVVVNQLHRSPGAAFKEEIHSSGRKIYSAKIVPYHGAWIEFEHNIRDVINVRLNRRKKLPATALLRAFGWGSDGEILKLFSNVETVSLDNFSNLEGRILADPIIDRSTGEVVASAGSSAYSEEFYQRLSESNIGEIRVLEKRSDNAEIECLLNTLEKDKTSDETEALKAIFKRLQPGEPPNKKNARKKLDKMFSDPNRYNLSKVGRYKLNRKLGMDISEDERTLRKEDVLEVFRYLLKVQASEGEVDDIDHLGNRRVRTVGELLENQFRIGLSRLIRAVRNKMTVKNFKESTPSDIIIPQPLTGAIKQFFGSSQLSQFMQQTNPLDELTHKRRLSALGPGGLKRDRAKFEVRDVHHTHYGRICPIETPEGPSVGLIVSLGTYARINEYGFLETPYRKIKDGKVTDEIEYLSADKEDKYVIAQANTLNKVDEDGRILKENLITRSQGDYIIKPVGEVNYIDVSPKQIVGVSASLIPFLEHDDANRALMGSNMQRQAVPLIRPDAPIVGTGMEYKAACDSGSVVLAKKNGVVESVNSDEIIVKTEDAFNIAGGEQSFSEMGYDVYKLIKFDRSNDGTCINQRPAVKVDDKVKEGDVIADSYSSDQGELALGANLLVAFVPWEGYNFEDAILISERLVKDDILTSVHIEEFEVEARDTKLGKEEITRDIPNASSEFAKNLDDEGIISEGSYVKPQDILVGKVTPKGESELGPEEKLLRAIFGNKTDDVRDASVYAKPGVEGIVTDAKVFSRQEKKKDRQTEFREQSKIKQARKEWKSRCSLIRQRKEEEIEDAYNEIRAALIGKELKQDLSTTPEVDGKEEFIALSGDVITGEIFEKIRKNDLLERVSVYDKDTADKIKATRDRINRVKRRVQGRIKARTDEKEREISKIESGDELPSGIVKLVKVYVAKKSKIAVGDKLSGRHGNKGVVAKILPEEDMPYLSDGTPVDIALNPLGVPSRMNIGQIFETHLGWAAKEAGFHIASPVFDGATEEEISRELENAGLSADGKTTIYDGRTGEPFDQEVTVGYTYMMKLHHLCTDKIHARATGPYSLVTQQPLGGKAQQGGQRLGEMEVWALEAYGASHTLQEMLTIKSDDVEGRASVYESIVKGESTPPPGVPESFNVLVKEMQGLGLDIQLERNLPLD